MDLNIIRINDCNINDTHTPSTAYILLHKSIVGSLTRLWRVGADRLTGKFLSTDFIFKQTDWTWWSHQMETFSALLALCVGNSLVPSDFAVSPICAWTNDWVNNRDAADLRCHRADYDATTMDRVYFMYAETGQQLYVYIYIYIATNEHAVG